MSCVPVSVTFELDTPDQLRRVVLTLTSEKRSDESEMWTIDFALWERGDNQSGFQVVDKVSVELGPEDFEGARTIAREGLCTGQRAQSLVAADTLKAFHYGSATSDDVRDDVVEIVRAE